MSTTTGEGNVGEPLFISQGKLEGWVEKGEVTFDDATLTLPAENLTYTLQPAVRIRSLLDGKDTSGLVGKVVSAADLQKMGAEHSQGAVILGETAYDCEEGFVGILKEAGVTKVVEASDSDLLADFLLKNL
jgi:hypothetical protein